MFGGKRRKRVAKIDSERLTFEALEHRIVLSASGLEANELAPVAVVSTQQPAALITTLNPIQDWVHSLPYWQFHLLAAETIPYLTTQQVATIPTPGYLAAIPAAARAAMSAAQVQAVNVANVGVAYLPSVQRGYLSVPQIQQVPFYELMLLSPGQVPSLTAAQIASIPTIGSLAAWTPAARAALTVPQIQALNIANVGLSQLTSGQIAQLTAPQVRQVKFYEFVMLAPTQIPSLTAAQVASIPTLGSLAAWSPAARAALTGAQVQSLNIANVGVSQLTSGQIAYLTAPQVQQVLFYEFLMLAPAQIPWLTAAQIASIPSVGSLAAWSPAARAAITGPQAQSLNITNVGISQLNVGQIMWLTAPQVRQVKFDEFTRLVPSQIPWLTAAQMASIPNVGSLAAWSPASRGSLTLPQVQAINIANVGMAHLPWRQRSYLSVPQIRQVPFYELRMLVPSQIPAVSAAQMASIPNIASLAGWSSAARAALTAPQVQALNVANVGVAHLPSLQIGYLTVAQIRQTPFYELLYLQPSQIPFLTAAQIGSISSTAMLATWSPAARAALTDAQVKALSIPAVGISQLTSGQIAQLSNAQVQQVVFYEFGLLNSWQIPLLTVAQLATLPDGGQILQWPDASQAALTREQLQNLPLHVYSHFAHIEYGLTPPSNYHPALHTVIGPDGVPISPHLTDEAAKFFALVPLQAATHVTVASGAWSSPSVWQNGQVPTAGAKVLISSGTTVQFDSFMNSALDTLRIDGTLSFATNRNTQLKADTIVVYTTGRLHIGTAANPIQDNYTARVLIADGGPIDRTWDPSALSRGLLSRGEVRMHGKTVTPYASLAVDPSAGDTTLTLTQAPTNWRVGDRLVIAGTFPTSADFGAEEVTIRGINGTTVTIDRLMVNHHAPDGYGLSVHVSNLTRNIVFAAEDASVAAERPHIVFFHNPNVQINNIAVEGFGRTDKSIPVNDPVVVNGVLQAGTGTNPRARYAMHFHHTGVHPAYAPAVVRGSVVNGSPGWGYVNHSSNVVMEDNVAYGVRGAAFVTEDGNEIGVMRRNLALNTTGTFDNIVSRREIHDFGFRGNGFWLQGPGVELVDNIAAGSMDAGFNYFTSSGKNLFDAINLEDDYFAGGRLAVPVGSVPIKRFEGNVSYAVKSGLEMWFHQTLMTDGESVIDDFTSWNTAVAGIDVLYSGHITVRDSLLLGDLNDFDGVGVSTNWLTHDMKFQNSVIVGFETGIEVPVRRSTQIDGVHFAAVRPILVEKGHDTIRSVTVTGNTTFAILTPAHLQGRQQSNLYLTAEFNFDLDFTGRRMASLYSQDYIVLAPTGTTPMQAYYYEQHPNYVPFPSAMASGHVDDDLLNKTVHQLWVSHGLTFAGGVAPVDAAVVPGIHAFMRALI